MSIQAPQAGQTTAQTRQQVQRAIEAVWRIEASRMIAVVARMLRGVGEAEEITQDALVAALERWPESGTPDNPAAWLMAVAKNRALDLLRHRKLARNVNSNSRTKSKTSCMTPSPTWR